MKTKDFAPFLKFNYIKKLTFLRQEKSTQNPIIYLEDFDFLPLLGEPSLLCLALFQLPPRSLRFSVKSLPVIPKFREIP